MHACVYIFFEEIWSGYLITKICIDKQYTKGLPLDFVSGGGGEGVISLNLLVKRYRGNFGFFSTVSIQRY